MHVLQNAQWHSLVSGSNAIARLSTAHKRVPVGASAVIAHARPASAVGVQVSRPSEAARSRACTEALIHGDAVLYSYSHHVYVERTRVAGVCACVGGVCAWLIRALTLGRERSVCVCRITSVIELPSIGSFERVCEGRKDVRSRAAKEDPSTTGHGERQSATAAHRALSLDTLAGYAEALALERGKHEEARYRWTWSKRFVRSVSVSLSSHASSSAGGSSVGLASLPALSS